MFSLEVAHTDILQAVECLLEAIQSVAPQEPVGRHQTQRCELLFGLADGVVTVDGGLILLFNFVPSGSQRTQFSFGGHDLHLERARPQPNEEYAEHAGIEGPFDRVLAPKFFGGMSFRQQIDANRHMTT